MRAFRVMIGVIAISVADAADETQEFRTGKAFSAALAEPFVATWEHSDLGTISRRIGSVKGVSLLLDRRIDPTAEVALTASGEPLRAFFDRVAETAGGRASVLAGTVYVGPDEAASKLRTLVQLRQRELAEESLAVSRTRRHTLTEPGSVTWADLDSPAQVLTRFAKQYELEIVEGLELVPYDLWAGSKLPETNAVEALSVLLIQFDLTFAWTEQAAGIRLVPVPERVALEQSHLPPRGMRPAAAIDEWREKFPGIAARAAGGEILVSGTVEEHEAIEQLRRPAATGSTKPQNRVAGPLSRQRYTLRIKDVPLSALLKKLGDPAHGEIRFEFDAQQLREAGIDINDRITLDVKNVPLDQLLEQAVEPLGLAFEVEARTVHLRTAGTPSMK